MKKRVTVIIALLACLVLAVCLFAACNDGGSTTNRGAFFTVTFDTQGGSAVDPVQVRRGGVLEQPEDPDRPGYIFAGWYLGEGKYDFGSRVSQDITLTAHWQARKITVRFVADAIAVKEIELDYGGSVAPEDIPAVPEKEGYTGVWDTVDLSGITSSVTVNAVYTFIEREVTFVLNYSGAEDVTVMTENGLIDFVPEREGYVFNGWWYSGGHTDGGYILTRRHDMEDVITEDGVTLYAEWVEEKEYASQLSAPSVSIDGSRFSWQEIEGATGYEVSVNTTPEESVVTVTDTYFDFPYYYDAGDYTVRIRARGDGTSTRNSAWTSKQYAHKILAAPTRIEINDTTSVLTWNGVMNASDYEIYVNGELKATVSVPHYDMSGYDAGEYRVRITAKSSGWISTSASADIMKARLKAPEVTVADTYDGYLLTWNAVVNADTYIVTIGEEEFRTDELSFTVSCGDDDLWQDLNELTVTVAAFDSGTEYLISLDAAENELIRKYPLTLSSDAGDVSGEGWYKAGERVNINAEIPTYAASSWLGWYKDGEKVSDARTYTFAMPSESVTLTARWIKVIAQSEDTDKGTVTPLTGTYFPGNKVTVTATTNLGYTFIGWYKGGEKVSDTLTYTFAMPSESMTLTARWIKVIAQSEDMDKGTVTPLTGTYFPGNEVTVTATTNLGYTFIGWYKGREKVSDTLTHTFKMPTENATYTARWELNEDMQPFIFSSDPSSLTITGVRDASVTEIMIPEYVTHIGGSAFSGCSSLESITTPFVGATKDGTGSTHFGYIFGASSYGNNDDCVPTSLKEVTITGGASIGSYAFYDCSGLTSVTIPNSVTSIGYSAFEDCTGLTSVTIGNGVTSIGSSAFLGCTGLTEINWNADAVNNFSSNSNVFYNAGTSGNGIAVTFGDSVTSIPAYLFDVYNSSCRPKVTSVTIGNNVTRIGIGAFYDCTGLTEIYYTGDVAGWCGISGLDEVMSSGRTLYIGGEKVEGALVIPDGVTSIGERAFYGCSGLTSVAIPDSVTSIGIYAFYGCTGLTSVTIGNGVTSIGNWAFEDCSGLTSVTIPDSVTYIGYYAFEGCTGLTSVTIGNGVTSIGDDAFYGCSSLTSIVVEEGNSVYHSAGNCLIKTASKTLIAGCKTSVIPNDGSVTSIGSSAFYGCSGLTSVTIPDSMTSIGDGAFYGCSGLTSITIPDNVTSIGDYAFYGCTGLTSVTIPDSVTYIGDSAFEGCTGLTSVTIGNGVTSIGWYAFSGCTGLTSVTIGNGVTWIGTGAFKGCNKLVEVYNKSSLDITAGSSGNGYVAYYAENVYTEDGGSWFTDTADDFRFFYDGTDGYLVGYYGEEKAITLPDGFTAYDGTEVAEYAIYDYAFYYCDGLTSVTIPDSVTSIGSYAFSGCTGLTSVTIPDSVTSIGSSAFEGCTSLTSITIPFVGATKNGTINTHFGYIFGASRYSDNDNYVPASLRDVVITGGTSIGDRAFEDCAGLTSVTIPDSVTNIGALAFEGCTGLMAVNFLGDAAGWCEIVFAGGYLTNPLFYAHNLYFNGILVTDLVIPDSVTHIGYYAFGDCNSLKSVTIGSGVTSVGSGAFSYCKNLTSIVVDEANPVYHDAGNCLIETESKTLVLGCKTSVIPDDGSVTSIGEYAFWGCAGLLSITIPDSVTSIGDWAFSYCMDLTSVTIGSGVTSIEDEAFSGCNKLVEVYNKSSLDITAGSSGNGNVAYYANNVYTEEGGSWFTDTADGFRFFYDGTGGYLMGYYGEETAITLPDGFTAYDGTEVTEYAIYDYAFFDCDSLTSVAIPDSVTYIGDSAFEGCTGLTSITIPDSVTSIGNSAFYGCTGLTSITIPDSVTYIGYYAFSGCTGLTTVTIPDSVTSIESYAFRGCAGLTSVTIGNGVTYIGYSAFSECDSLTSVTFENTTGWYRTSSSTATSGTSLSSISLDDSFTAAEWLTSTYDNYYWKRGV